MTIEVINCTQGDEDWRKARCGIPTASEFKKVLTKAKTPGAGVRFNYLMEKLGERLTGVPTENYWSSVHADRGHQTEEDARQLYSMLLPDAELIPSGFIRNGLRGCSADSLIGTNGVLEIKTKLPALHIPLLLYGKIPDEHYAQFEGLLLVSEREYCDLMAHWPGLPPYVKRIYRDEQYLKMLDGELKRFTDELLELEARCTKIKRRVDLGFCTCENPEPSLQLTGAMCERCAQPIGNPLSPTTAHEGSASQ